MLVLLLQLCSYAFYTIAASSFVYLLLFVSYLYSAYFYYIIGYYCLIAALSITMLALQYTITTVDPHIDVKYQEARDKYISKLRSGALDY